MKPRSKVNPDRRTQATIIEVITITEMVAATIVEVEVEVEEVHQILDAVEVIILRVKNKKTSCGIPNTQKSLPWFQNVQHDTSCFDLNFKGEGIR